MKNKKVNTKIIISELHRAFKIFNDNLFDGTLPEPAIIIAPKGKKSLALGWCTVSKIWKNDLTLEERYEINIVAEALNRGIYPVMSTLLHEMVHLYNLVNEIKDVSRGGTYHNAKFKRVAENHGLVVEHRDGVGWSHTYLQGTTMDLVDSARFDEAVFSFGRRDAEDLEDDLIKNKRKRKKNSIRKYVCPRCHGIIRASRQVNVICGDCYKESNLIIWFEEEKEPDTDENGNPAITIEPTEYEPVEDSPKHMVEFVCRECGCITTTEAVEDVTYICPECRSTNVKILNETILTAEECTLDDGWGNMVDVVQGKIEIKDNKEN